MSDRFFDVPPNSWFFNDVIEVENILDVNDRPFISGIPFNSFIEGHEAIDILVSITTPSNILIIDGILTHTMETPIKVYIDGINIVFDSVTANKPVIGKSEIKLKRVVNPSSSVRVIQQGIPATDPNNHNKPLGVTESFSYPLVDLGVGSTYTYNPFSSIGSEQVKVNGSQLKRIEYVSGMPSNYNFFKDNDEYTISPLGTVYLPFQLDNVTVNIDFLATDAITHVESVKHVNSVAKRPNGYDNVYFGFFPDVLISRAEFFTFLNNLRKNLWNNFAVIEPYIGIETASRFGDVNNALTEARSLEPIILPWWWAAVRDLEELKMPDGSYFLIGYPDGNLYYDNTITRAEIIIILDKFRLWFVEAFK